MIDVISIIFGIIPILVFIVVVCLALRNCLCDSPVAEHANDHNMFALQPMLIPNGNALRAGQIE